MDQEAEEVEEFLGVGFRKQRRIGFLEEIREPARKSVRVRDFIIFFLVEITIIHCITLLVAPVRIHVTGRGFFISFVHERYSTKPSCCSAACCSARL